MPLTAKRMWERNDENTEKERKKISGRLGLVEKAYIFHQTRRIQPQPNNNNLVIQIRDRKNATVPVRNVRDFQNDLERQFESQIYTQVRTITSKGKRGGKCIRPRKANGNYWKVEERGGFLWNERETEREGTLLIVTGNLIANVHGDRDVDHSKKQR